MSIFDKLKSGLQKTRDGFTANLKNILSSNKGLTEELIEEIEETLITGDIGVDTTLHLIDVLREKLGKEKNLTYEQIVDVLKQELTNECETISGNIPENNNFESKPHVILVTGVNGTGKTTSIGKLSHYYKQQGKNVILAAADTFRAAAVEQLEVWKDRVGVDLIKNKEGTDPAAVAFDSVQAAVARSMDILIVDTAGRIHTNTNLMQELEKVKRVINKALPGAPHETLLVLDGNTGQNSITQAKIFTSTLGVDGLILTKLDGTAKGGAAIPIMKNLKIPIKYIGIGEQIEDFQLFNIKSYIDALFV
ncbi:MAG: signal recognition particle-docking protein FtsY [bacterium]|nr:signal recognition particle-docking protein FtsY [bacterium]